MINYGICGIIGFGTGLFTGAVVYKTHNDMQSGIDLRGVATIVGLIAAGVFKLSEFVASGRGLDRFTDGCAKVARFSFGLSVCSAGALGGLLLAYRYREKFDY